MRTFSIALLLCLAKDSFQSSLFSTFVSEVQPHFTSALSKLGDLVNTALSFDPSSQSLTADYFRNPAVQNAIRETHAPLVAALSIASRHVAKYDTRIATATSDISDSEAQIRGHQSHLGILHRQRREQQNLVASLQWSIDHNQRQIDEHRLQLEKQQKELESAKTRKMWFWIFFLVPFVALGIHESQKDIDLIEGKIRHLESNMEGFRNSKQQAENQVNAITAQIRATDQTIRDTQSVLQQKQSSLQILHNETKLIIELGIKLKNSNIFLSQLEGKVDVMKVSNRLSFVLESVLNSLEDLLVFLSNNISTNVAAIATTQGLQQLRQLLQQSLA